MVAYLTGREIKNCLEFLLPGNPNLPGQYFPRVSGMRFRYDLSRPQFEAVTQIELGDLAHGYRAIDFLARRRNSTAWLATSISDCLPRYPRRPTARSRSRRRRRTARRCSRERTRCPPSSRARICPPKGAIDKDEVARDPKAASLEIKEWQAIMNYLKSLSTKNAQGVTVLAMDERMNEDRSVALVRGR